MAASTSSPCAARRPVRTLFASLLLCLAAAGPLDAAQPPSRLRLTVPAAPVAPGQEARLTIELLGEDRQPLATPRDRKVELRGADALSRITTVTIPAGSSAVEVAVTAPKPGLWQIEVASPGLSSAAGVVVSLAHPPSQVSHPAPVPPPPRKLPAPASAPRPSPTAIRLPAPPPAAGPQTMEARRPEPGALALKRPVASLLAHPRETAAATAAPSPSTASTGTMNAPPATSAPAAPAPAPPPPVSADGGHVELIAQPLKLRQGHQGWETSKVQAYWFAGEAPVPASRDLQLSLVLTGGSGNTAIDPGLLSIPHGAFMSPTAAQISARGIDTAVVKALYDGGVSQPVEISFLPTVPAQLGFEGPAEVVRGLATVASDVYVRLLGDDGQPATTDQAVPVAVQGPAGTVSQAVSIPAGTQQARIAVDLTRQGPYTVRASAPGLRDADPFTVTYAIDWLLIGFALAGGVLGSLARVLYRRARGRSPGRVVILGVLAAFLTLLLFSFGLLSLIDGILPEGLSKLPSHGPFAALLLGFLAGLSFDKIFGRFLSGGEPAKARG